MIKIIADSGADLIDKEERFKTVPLKIIAGEKEFTDDKNLDVSEMISYLSSYKGKSSTACPGTGDWISAFGEADEIFAITLTSGLSGSYNSAFVAKKEYEESFPERKVYVIDSLSAGPELKLFAERIEEYIKEGLSFSEISEKIEEYKKSTGLLFSLESLKNFANNGRVSKVTARLAGVLGIRIIGKASDGGTLEPLAKTKGNKKALKELSRLIIENGYSGGKVRIDHCKNPDGAEFLKDIFLSEFPDADIIIAETFGLCSYYAEEGGILIAFEK